MNSELSNGKPSMGRWLLSAPLLIALWLFIAFFGMALMARYSNAPGKEGTAPLHWPSETRISPQPNQPTLIMFAHPRCPCTRASMDELAQLSAHYPNHFVAQVWFIKPTGTDGDWTNSSLWHLAAAIPGVTPYCDNAGLEATRFHATTSGQMVLYNKNGDLLFQGGITASRGHAGDNAGLSALEALLSGAITNRVQAKVFGCPLFPSES